MKSRPLTLQGLAFATGLALVFPSCRKPAPQPDSSASDAPSAAPAPTPAASRLEALLLAENQRDPAAVRDDDLASPKLDVRRAAARALARINDPKASERLLGVLADGDPEVLSWSAYGLGESCESNRDRITRALIARALSLAIEPPLKPGRLDPWFALARALGQCATPEGEKSLAAWLDAPRARASTAALGLGDVATRRKRIDEETSAELLRAAAGDAARDPLAEAFYPFSRLKVAPPRAVEQELEIARARLGHAEPGRTFVVRALGKVGEAAVDELAKVATTPGSFSAGERAEAAKALGNIGGRKGQAALLKVISALSPPNDPVALTGLVGAGFHPLATAIDALDPAEKGDFAPLKALATLSIPPKAPAAVQRRIASLRCASARVLAGMNPEDPGLLQCDAGDSGAGAMARLAVLGRGKLVGARAAAWRAYLDPKIPVRVREAALRMIAAHPEIVETADVLADALESKDLGLVAEAAEQLAQNPDRAFLDRKRETPAGKPKKGAEEAPSKLSDRVVKALTAAMQREYPPDGVEIVGDVAKAAGALRLEAARKTLETLCRSSNPTLRNDAQAALASLDGKKVTCQADASKPSTPAAELGHLLTAPVKVQLQTDAGALVITLDPSLAPISATRIADLVAKGFFNGNVVHRVVAGYVVQFGDPWGDGYGGPGLPPLRCETSPVAFVEGTVGVALGGRDTGSSQIFVTLAASPHIDGHYAVIGKAEGPWDAVAEGDAILKAFVVK